MKTIKVMRDGGPATAEELQCAVDDKPLPPSTCSAMETRIRDALRISRSWRETYAIKGDTEQCPFAAGQIDAFEAVLKWMHESQQPQVKNECR